MTRTFIFDLDGTLVDSVPDLRASCNRLAVSRAMAPFSAAEITAMVGDGAAALVRRAMRARGSEATPADLDAFLTDYTAHAAIETRLYPGAVDAMDRLAARGWRLAVCTNKPEAAARRLLDALGLHARFAAIGGGDTHSSRKPDPAHLLATLHDAGGTPGAALMLGDHHNDMAAAKDAGIPAIFAAWGYGPPGMAAGAPAAQSFPDVPDLAEHLVPG